MSTYIKDASGEIQKIDTAEMIEVDRLMIEEYHIELIQMMENAGRCLAIIAREEFLDQDPEGKRIAILAGTGGNGGGALVCARRLHNWGAKVDVFMTKGPDRMTPIPLHQLNIVKRMGISVQAGENLGLEASDDLSYDLLIDGVIGYSVKGDPYGVPGDMIHWLNQRKEPVLSLDTPSGLDLSSGKIHQPTVKADATLTLALPKKGLFQEAARKRVGKLFLGDISVPPQLYQEPSLGLKTDNLFRYSDIVKIY